MRRRAAKWFVHFPPAQTIKWGPRNTVNIEQSALLLSLQHVADHRETYLDNYWLKNQTFGRKRPNGSDVRVGDSGRPAPRRSGRGRCRQRSAPAGLNFESHRRLFRAGERSHEAGDFIVPRRPAVPTGRDQFAIRRIPAGARGL